MTQEIRTLVNKIGAETTENDGMMVEGYALRFNTWSEDLGGFKETISPDALKGLNFDDVRLLYNHDWGHVLARQSAGNLDLSIDDVGLRFKAILPETVMAKDVYQQIRSGNINQCSFMFTAAADGINMVYDKVERIYKRTINTISKLPEISIVSLPAYKTSDVSIAAKRSVIEAEKQRKLQLLKLEIEIDEL